MFLHWQPDLKETDFLRLKNGCYVASVTSADDEFDLGGLADTYNVYEEPTNVTRYSTDTDSFFLMNSGNAINFLHQTSVGPYIHLVQAELILAAIKLAKHRRFASNQIVGLPKRDRQQIARLWLKYYKK